MTTVFPSCDCSYQRGNAPSHKDHTTSGLLNMTMSSLYSTGFHCLSNRAPLRRSGMGDLHRGCAASSKSSKSLHFSSYGTTHIVEWPQVKVVGLWGFDFFATYNEFDYSETAFTIVLNHTAAGGPWEQRTQLFCISALMESFLYLLMNIIYSMSVGATEPWWPHLRA